MNIKKSIIKFLDVCHIKYPRFMLPTNDVVLPFDGQRILIRNPRVSRIGRSIYLRGIWEPAATHFISSKIEAGVTALDVGADIGYYTLLFAKRVGPKGRVFAFEPIPKAKQYLDRNIEMNGFHNVKTFDFALFDESGKMCLEAPFTKSKINPSRRKLCSNDIEVKVKVFDEWAPKERIDAVDLIKLDVEGAELNVLRGMRSTLREQCPKILIEVHPEQLNTFGFLPSDVIEFLSDFGYHIEPVDKPEINFSQGNIILFADNS